MTRLWRNLRSLVGSLDPLRRARQRLQLSLAKHPSLTGHPRMARRLARLIPAHHHEAADFYATDGAPAEVVALRRAGFERLADELTRRSPRSIALSAEIEGGAADLAFVNAYRVPYQYRDFVRRHLRLGSVVVESEGDRVRDLDGVWTHDLGGSYGVNLFGVDFYRRCIAAGVERAQDLGLVLGPYHPVVADNLRRLRQISGLDQASFHMSGTEAVMQAVRLARYHTRRTHVVRFCGAYHGWWDGVQAGVGNPRPASEVYTLREMHARTLSVLRSRDDIACVLVNPIQAMHPNGAPPTDSTLVSGARRADIDKAAYTRWLRQLRAVCSERGIVLIFDEVFLGFRLAIGGAQEYFGVRADLVTYGKSLGGGLPVGVVCGRAELMRRFRDDRPVDVCLARGTFNAHPYVMATMNEFLRHLDEPAVRADYARQDARWDGRAARLNARLEALALPVRVANLMSVWTTLYTQPGRYHWMFQYYLRAAGLSLGWIGTGRLIFSHALSDQDFDAIVDRFVAAAEAMRRDGWWWQDTTLSERSIRRRLLGEVAGALLSAWRGGSGRSARPAAAAAAPRGRA